MFWAFSKDWMDWRIFIFPESILHVNICLNCTFDMILIFYEIHQRCNVNFERCGTQTQFFWAWSENLSQSRFYFFWPIYAHRKSPLFSYMSNQEGGIVGIWYVHTWKNILGILWRTKYYKPYFCMNFDTISQCA